MIEVTGQINAVERKVGDRTIEAGEARYTVVGQTYKAAIDDVWDAVTSAERIPRWFLPVSGDLRLGGRYQLEGNAGGTIEACDPPNSYNATWEYGDGVSWIEVRLTSLGEDSTRFELVHIAPVDPKWEEFGPGAVGIGWDMSLLGLAIHLGSGAAVDPAETAAWMVSEEGKQFMIESNDRWYDADVAAGADPEKARAAADRTIAAYTTPPPAEG